MQPQDVVWECRAGTSNNGRPAWKRCVGAEITTLAVNESAAGVSNTSGGYGMGVLSVQKSQRTSLFGVGSGCQKTNGRQFMGLWRVSLKSEITVVWECCAGTKTVGRIPWERRVGARNDSRSDMGAHPALSIAELEVLCEVCRLKRSTRQAHVEWRAGMRRGPCTQH
jgi:hypothetical protein